MEGRPVVLTGGVVRYWTREREQSFWARGKATGDGCLEWQGARLASGYGVMSVGRTQASAHRVAVQLMGHDVTGLHVLHLCDNPPCFAPPHLRVGTHLDNMRDLNDKGLGNQGERNGCAKLTDDLVREIRTGKRSMHEWSHLLGLTPQAIARAFRRQTWKHVA